MNRHKKQLSLPESFLPIIVEKPESRKRTSLANYDPYNKYPEIKKFEAFLLDTFTKRDRITKKF